MWSDDKIFRRTSMGDEEIAAPGAGIGKELRNLLLLINGKRTWGELKAIVSNLQSSPAEMLYLEDNGFIESSLGHSPSAMVHADRPSPPPVLRSATPNVRASVSRPAPSRLSEFRIVLAVEVSALFGAEAPPVLKKISELADPSAAESLLERLVDMITLYAGAREAKRVSEKFNGWFK